MKLYVFIFLALLPMCVLSQNGDGLVFHFQTKFNYLQSDYDLIVGEKVTVWKEVSNPTLEEGAYSNIDNIVPVDKDYERQLLFKQRDKNVCIYKYEPFNRIFYLADTLPKLSWRLREGHKVSILKYECNEASMNFRGREYRVWYTSQIPLSEGPWKLSGLPGMILRVEVKGQGDNFKMECYEIGQHTVDTKAMLKEFLHKEGTKNFSSWPAFVCAFEQNTERKINKMKAEMASQGVSGYTSYVKLNNQLEIFLPVLQTGEGIIVEF
jgi:GLPGLI family protein